MSRGYSAGAFVPGRVRQWETRETRLSYHAAGRRAGGS